ncbi:MAG: hypothetical protein J6I73_08375 [Treponema sp.]|nr:hypothetical protein [Treponema sp.]
MKALLDTNIIIHCENTTASNYGIGLLFYWLDKLNYEKCIHPYSEQELRKFQDNNMQSLYDAKLPAYITLQTIATQSDDFKSKLPEEKSQNDKIDNQLLYEVYCNRVDILITEDKNLRKRSELFSLRSRVLSINDFISKCTAENPDLISYKMLAVKKDYFGNINVKDSFFDTFRVAYSGFDNWFAKKSNEEIYICRTDKSDILGFLYIKTENETENYSDIKPVFQPKKRLKIGTFKIETSGFRLGERFIKIIFDNALERNVDEIYVTLFEDRPELKALEDLLTVWGFYRYGIKQSNEKEEVVFVKKLKVYDSQLSVKQNYPNILFRKRQKFILPIYAKYHTNLLPDSKLNTENEIDFLGKEPHRYALQKVYISWSPERNIKPGDLIVFYRMAENHGRKKYESVLSTVGIVDNIRFGFRNKEEFLATCQNRSVFSKAELDGFWNNHSKNLLVLRFIFVKSLTKRLTLEYLWNRNIIPASNGPRPFTRISDEQFRNILRDSQTKITFIEENNV